MLTINNLSAGYGKVQVLHGISIDVPKGKVVTLIGSNGAGKTTTMRAVSGMIAPTGGDITLNGKRIEGKESYDIAKLGLAHSPEGRRVFATMTVTDNLILGAFPRLTGSRPKGDVTADLDRALDLFPRLKERRMQLAGTLSGGEQQMLAISRALMSRPKLVLFDEPSLGLAPMLVEEIFTIIKRLVDQEKLTVLLVEQNATMALAVAHHGYVMENGRIVLEGTAAQLRENSDIREFYLGLNEGGARKSYRDVKHYKRRKRWLS